MPLLLSAAGLALLLSGAIFGFFYAWVCSTMWGLDAADPRLAIGAMQAMNASVRNAVFAPAFFGTPLAQLVAAVLAIMARRGRSAIAFGIAALVYLGGGLLLTLLVNVPMNEALALVAIPADAASAAAVWRAYSEPWQMWNLLRTAASGISLLLVGYGIFCLRRPA